MRLSLFQRVAIGGVLPVAALSLLFAAYTVWHQKVQAANQRQEELSRLAHDRISSLDNLLQSAARPVRRTAQLGTLIPDLPTPTYWKWLAGLLDDNPAFYGVGITFWPANRNHSRKDLYALRGHFGNVHDDKYYYQDETYTYDGADGTHEWFSLPQKLGHPVWTEPYFDEGSGNVWMITYAAPFYRSKDHTFDGVAFTDLQIDTLQEQIKLTGQFKGPFAVLDADGHFIFHSDVKLAGKLSAGWSKDVEVNSLLQAGHGLDSQPHQVVNWPGLGRAWVIKAGVPNTNWELLSAIPDLTVWAGLDKHELMTAAVLLLVLLTTVAMALMVARRHTLPLGALTMAVDAAAKGDWSVPINYWGKDEMGELAASFREMRKHIADRDSSLREINSSLERRVAERAGAILALEQRLGSITRSMPGVLFQLVRVSSGNYRYTYLSEGAERLTGVSAEAAVADVNRALKIIHPKDAPGLLEIISQAGRTGSGYEADYRIIHAKTGKLRWLHTQASVTSSRDGSCTWSGTHVDISAQKKLELALIIAKREADEANIAKGRFLASMSHELRTPLNAVIGLADLTLQTPLAAQQKDWVGKIHRAANTLLQLVNDVLDFSKLESGKMEMETLRFDVGRVLDTVLDMVQHLAAKKNLRLELQLAPDVPPALCGDALRLTQVLLNLMSNAIKFTHDGEVVLAVSRLADVDGKVELRFAVRDTGIGVSLEAQKKLFRAFTQADATTTRRYGGTGLGLAICQQIVAQLGGSVAMESTPGVGSCFYFTLRFGLPEAGAAGGSEEPPISRRLPAIEPAPAEEETLPALDASSRQKLLEQIHALDGQLARADGDAVEVWLALVEKMPWLGNTAAGKRASVAMSSYRFPDARSALDQLASTLP